MAFSLVFILGIAFVAVLAFTVVAVALFRNNRD